jgi:hypothetical protein
MQAERQSKVIYAGTKFTTRRATSTTLGSASIVKVDFKALSSRPEQACRTFSPLEALPFVKLTGGGRRARAGYRRDVPTGNGREDFKRGQEYAALTIEAIAAERCAPWDLERIIEAIVIDAASRKAKGGAYSRTLPPSVDGFVHELSRQLCLRITGSEPGSTRWRLHLRANL